MLEKQIQAAILTYLKTLPECWAVKTIQTNKLGTPDILACINGKFIGLEVKTTKGKATEIQLYQMAEIVRCGGISAVVRSVDDVKAILERV